MKKLFGEMVAQVSMKDDVKFSLEEFRFATKFNQMGHQLKDII